MPVTVTHEQVARFLRRRLFHAALYRVRERLRAGVDFDAEAPAGDLIELTAAARIGIALAPDLLSGTVAGVDRVRLAQTVQCSRVPMQVVALPTHRQTPGVWYEAQPVEVLEEGEFEGRPTAPAVVVLDAEEHMPAQRARDAPDIDGVHDVAQVQVPCGRWGEACQRRSSKPRGEDGQVWAHGHGVIVAEVRVTIPWLGEYDPFPPVDQAMREPDGLLAAGGDLSPERLLAAYTLGIFPWLGEGDPLLWWSPDPRMVLWLHKLHVSRSLRRTIRSGRYAVTLDTAFDQVMAGCAGPRRHEDGTWITAEMTEAYQDLAALGHAHSVETWSEGALVGGLYGVAIGRMFFGESMFSRSTDASKVAVAALVAQLGRWGFEMVDCQMSTSHLASLGAHEIPRAVFVGHVNRLVRQRAVPAPWVFDAGVEKTL